MGSEYRLVDTHAHLVSEAFENDCHEAIDRAREAGVAAVLCVADGVESSQAAVELAAERSEIWATVGIHPHQAGEAPEDIPAALKPIFERDRVVALGEMGLDYHYDFAPVTQQKRVFREQLRLACDLKLPVVIHNREADQDVIRILQDEGAERVGGVLHCFWSDWETASVALGMGFHLGVGGPVTFKRSEALRALLEKVPLERLLVETDSPYLAPVPYRGKRNEPAYVVESARVLAEVKGVTMEELASVTTENAAKLFNLDLNRSEVG